MLISVNVGGKCDSVVVDPEESSHSYDKKMDEVLGKLAELDLDTVESILVTVRLKEEKKEKGD